MAPQNSALTDRVALITGGGHGIGAGIASRLAEMGALSIICGRSQGTLEDTAQAITRAGGRCQAVRCDVTRLDSVEAMAAQVQKEHGRLDILVNNAGVGGWRGPLHRFPPEDWERVFNTNLRGVYYCIRAFAPMMIAARLGDIVNISSLAGKNALPNGAAYAASKWGLNGLSYSVAEELRQYNIRVTVICPGSTNSDWAHSGKDVGKMLLPSDVAHVVGMIVTQAPQSFASEVLLRPTQKP